MPAVIDRFDGEHRWLSNFAPAFVLLDGKPFQSVEHAYQAAKSLDPDERDIVSLAATPGKAKRLGRNIELRPDWGQAKVPIMLGLLRQKFRQPRFKSLLLGTGDATLIEGNHWGDTFWGVCKGKGQNMLGKLLMQVRQEIRDEQPVQREQRQGQGCA